MERPGHGRCGFSSAVGTAIFGGGILVGVMVVIAAGIRAEGQLAWRRGRSRCGMTRRAGWRAACGGSTGLGCGTGEAGGRPTGAGPPRTCWPCLRRG